MLLKGSFNLVSFMSSVGFLLLFNSHLWFTGQVHIYLFVVGGYNSGGGDMITQEDTVFVSGMSPNLTEEDIEQHFGSIGVIKVSKKKK